MDDNKNLNEVNESAAVSEMSNEDLKKAIGDYLTKERGEAMILGCRVACRTILQMIAPWRQKGCSKREHERLFKKLEEFCGKALKQDEETPDEAPEETVQN